ncbi:hypothetical protein J7363_04705 [Phaeobacter italicus]|uniref:hypothetical protein n=1 Tax=Phaeobacter italicus TaxID=481446 RepID=UPI001ADBD407|nr:hypothetical protein [Phaeobacter italicus]MBO9441381.1 hypothetical protein [Phaeobacter italicus]
MANISGNTIGVDFTKVWSDGLAQPRPFKTGTTVLGDDGKTYQYAKASATIASGNTAVNITLSSGEYVAANSGGSADNASGVSLAAGDHAWFKID